MNSEKLKEEILNYIRFDKLGVEKLLKKCETLYEQDDGIIDFKNEEEWNEEYFYELFPATRKNFSREKVEELLKVHDKVRGKVKEDNNSTKIPLLNQVNSEKLKEDVLNYIRFDKPGVEKLLKKCEELYVVDDGIIDFKSEEEWTEEYFYELFPATRKNFSREKVEELLKVHDKVRGKVKEETEANFKEAYFDKENRKKVKKIEVDDNKNEKSGFIENAKHLAVGVVVGVVAGYKIGKEYIKNSKNRGKK